jgi:hypothetical protein
MTEHSPDADHGAERVLHHHPAVAAAADLLGPVFRVLAVAEREDAVVALFAGYEDDELMSRMVIAEHVDGVWRQPNVIGGSPMRLESRRSRTVAWDPFVGFARTQSGWPAADGSRPSVAWMAVTGIAASDVRSVRVVTDYESADVGVETDGRFLALVRAAWGADPVIEVTTEEGNTVEVHP